MALQEIWVRTWSFPNAREVAHAAPNPGRAEQQVGATNTGDDMAEHPKIRMFFHNYW